MNVLAVDPGKISGWATWYGEDYDEELAPEERFDSGELPHVELLDWAHKMLADEVEFDLLVCESFLITAQTLQKTRGENWSLEQIGALRWFAHRAETEFALQSPADAKSFATDVKLKRAGFYVPGRGHANDAARHLLVALARRDPETFKTLVA